ncbi:MAG: helix-turn-helix domain-containing protein, partial [Anaerorhabdus sp.]
MNDKKSMYYTQVILKSLIESSDMVTTEQLAEEVGLSEKTIRTKIESINNILMENNLGIICKKRRIGIWLDATDEQKLQIQRLLINQNSFEHLHSDQSRMFTALKYILSFSKNNRLTTNKLSEEMFLSIPTTLKIINDCKDWLNLFDIQLKIIRNKGFELKCNESQYRIALKHFLLKLISDESIDERLKYFMPGLDLEKVKKCILVTEKEWGIEFAEESFNEIYAFLCMSITRPNVNEKFHVEIPINELRMLQA